MPEYFVQLRKLVDFKMLRRRRKKGRRRSDVRNGRGYLDVLLDRSGWDVDALHGEINPRSATGIRSRSRSNMGELLARMKRKRVALGLGLDPDADRFAVIDSDGTFINANQVLALTLYHLAKNRKWTGAVVRTVATSHLVDAVPDCLASRFTKRRSASSISAL